MDGLHSSFNSSRYCGDRHLFPALCVHELRPVKQVVDEIATESPALEGSEMQVISGAFREQRSQKMRLERQIDDQRRMMIDRINKCMLGGRSLTNAEFEMLHWQNTNYFVAVADMTQLTVLDEEQRRALLSTHIPHLTMQTDRYDAFVCFLSDDSRCTQCNTFSSFGVFWARRIRALGSAEFIEQSPN